MRIGTARRNKQADRREAFEVRHDPDWDMPAEETRAAGADSSGEGPLQSRISTLEGELRDALEAQAALVRRVELLEALVQQLRATAPAPTRAPARKRSVATPDSATANPAATSSASRTTRRRNTTKAAVGE